MTTYEMVMQIRGCLNRAHEETVAAVLKGNYDFADKTAYLALHLQKALEQAKEIEHRLGPEEPLENLKE